MNNRENEKELRNNQVSEWSYLTGRSGSPKNLCSSSRWQTVISGGNRISAVCTASCETIVARAKGSLWQSKTWSEEEEIHSAMGYPSKKQGALVQKSLDMSPNCMAGHRENPAMGTPKLGAFHCGYSWDQRHKHNLPPWQGQRTTHRNPSSETLKIFKHYLI